MNLKEIISKFFEKPNKTPFFVRSEFVLMYDNQNNRSYTMIRNIVEIDHEVLKNNNDFDACLDDLFNTARKSLKEYTIEYFKQEKNNESIK